MLPSQGSVAGSGESNAIIALGLFPPECLLRIFEFVHIGTLASLARVCRRWKNVLEDSYLWHCFIKSHRFPSPAEARLFQRAFLTLYREEQLWARRPFTVTRLPLNHSSCLSLCLTPDFVVTGTEYGFIVAYDRTRHHVCRQITAHRGPVSTLATAPNGTVYSAAFDGCVHAWDPATWQLRATFKSLFAPHITCMVVTDDLLITGHLEQLVCVWNRANRELVSAISVPFQVLSLASQDGYLIVGGSAGNMVLMERSRSVKRTWDSLDGCGHALPAAEAADSLAARAGKELLAALRTPFPYRLAGKFKGHSDTVMSVSISEGRDKVVLSASYDSTVRLWSLQSREPRAVLRGHTDEVYGAEFVSGLFGAPGGDDGVDRPHRVVSWGQDSRLLLWDLRSPATPMGPLCQRELNGAAVDCVAVAGGSIVTGYSNGKVYLYNAER